MIQRLASRPVAIVIFFALVLTSAFWFDYLEQTGHGGQAWNCFGSQPIPQAITAFVFRPSGWPFIVRWLVTSVLGVALLMFLSCFG